MKIAVLVCLGACAAYATWSTVTSLLAQRRLWREVRAASERRERLLRELLRRRASQ